ncbi:MAG: NAD(P)-dependent alcohol dehydrogenase [Gemmatimonadota bacterium]|nr:NAD(P)-dependent alcohol dehydrogenase [Gemmatimonadota bacterium]
MFKNAGYAALSATTPLVPFAFERRDPGPTDVQLDILYCGVCHSDLHQARNEWKGSTFPIVPGHEIVGRVVRIGAAVTGFKAGDLAGVGTMVDSCRTCLDCREGLEQFCPETTFTYNSPDRHTGGVTYGGYATSIVVEQGFVLHVSEKLNPAAVAPLLCAGITTWSPLRHWKVGKGQKVGVVGLGGLGHMGVKFAHALGAHVVLFTTSPGKAEDARRLGADEIVLTKHSTEFTPHAKSLDFILDTVAVSHNLDPYLGTLTRDGTLCLVGLPETPNPSPSIGRLMSHRRQLSASMIGGLRETQEMLDFCAERGVVSDIEMIPMPQINAAYERMLRSDVKYRFVIDLKSLKA